MSTPQQQKSRLANLVKNRSPDDPELVNARRDYYAERLAEHVAGVVAKAPPLTHAQRDRISTLLSGASKGA